ncbi:MAG: helix-turn-helix transcriptional regulator [Oscillospiraceae bacterium]|nr:helix-turn-helix transcriptional regulator [Oscillospiraceae bacterium]MBR2890172.1 helix-turn-helix transcriptional regulator [Oscillospiraceae bacterium]
MKSSAKPIGENIRILRTEQNMTQDELAEALFVTRQTVSNYETGRSNPDVQMLLKIAEVLSTDIDTLIFGKPEPPDRREDRRRLIRSCVLSGVLVLLWLLLLRPMQYAASIYFSYQPLHLARYLLVPGIYLSLGYSLMELVRYFIGIKPVPQRSALLGRRITWGVLAFYGVLLIPTICFMAYGFYLSLTTDGYSLSMDLGVLLNHLLMYRTELAFHHPYLFAVPGLALSLFRKNDQKPG